MPEFKLLLEDDEVESLKIIAARQRVRPQSVAREAFRRGMASPVPTHTHPVPNGDSTTQRRGIRSVSPSQLTEIRDALNRALAVIDGVLDGQSVSDEIGELEAELDSVTALSDSIGADRKAPQTHGVTQTKGRRAR